MTAPWALLVATVATALAVVAGAVLPGPAVPTRPPPRAVSAARPAVAAAAVLRQWDVRRSRAWARGDLTALRSLYTAGSAAGRTDRAMLRAWLRRGLRVTGLRMQVLAVRVRSRSPDRLVLLVTDRLARGAAVGSGGTRVPLPRDAASTRVVTLRRAAGVWRRARVLAQRAPANPARTTSSTVRSRNR